MSYRAYEDKNGFVKHFGNNDIEFEVIMSGLDSLKGSSKWGETAKDLSYRFTVAFDGLISTKELKDEPQHSPAMKQYLDAIRCSDHFKPCDVLTFRKTHDECIRFFQEVQKCFSILTVDDKRTSLK